MKKDGQLVPAIIQLERFAKMDDGIIGGFPKGMTLEESLPKFGTMGVPETVASVNETATIEYVDSDSIRWKRTSGGIVKMQKEEEATPQICYWAGTRDETNYKLSPGINIIRKEQAIQYGPETLARWSS